MSVIVNINPLDIKVRRHCRLTVCRQRVTHKQ